jgi:hypothetical protein
MTRSPDEPTCPGSPRITRFQGGVPLFQAHPNKQRLWANPPTGISQFSTGISHSLAWDLPMILLGYPNRALSESFSPTGRTKELSATIPKKQWSEAGPSASKSAKTGNGRLALRCCGANWKRGGVAEESICYRSLIYNDIVLASRTSKRHPRSAAHPMPAPHMSAFSWP